MADLADDPASSPDERSMVAERAPRVGGARAFFARNSDALVLELIGSVVLALVVSLLVFGLDQAATEQRDSKAESLSNSIFVRQSVMGGNDVLPFSGLNLRDAQLSGLPLTGADFSDADLAGAELKDADLSHALLAEADLSGADLSDSVLAGADLSEAVLDDTNLSNADFTGTQVTDVDFSTAFYLEGAPPIGLDAIDDLQVRPDPDDD